MGVKRVEIVTCDECGEKVDTGDYAPWIDAMVYGVTFHNSCWSRIGGPRVARLLDLDEIKMRGGGCEGERAMEAIR